MKNIYNISQLLKKILVIVLLVMSLAACGENEELVNKACSSSESNQTDCVDTSDAGCLGCSIFALMFRAVSTNTMKLHGQLTNGAMAIMMVAFSIWLAVRLLKFVSSVTESSISQVWNEIIKQAFLCLVCGFLASSPSALVYAVNTFVYPIYATFLKIGIAIMENAVANSDGTAQTVLLFGETTNIGQVNITCTFDKAGIITEQGFPQAFLDTITCMIRVLKSYLGVGGQISVDLMKQDASFMGRLAGFTLLIFFWIVRIGFVFFLVDTIFQMGIIMLVLPIFILSYAFQATRSWTTTIFKNLLTSAAFLMCFSIIVTLVLRAMIELINGNKAIFSPSNPEFQMATLGIGFLCLLLIGFLIYGSMGVASQITGAIIGNKPDDNFQKKLLEAAKMVQGWVVKGLSAVISQASSMMPAEVVDKIQKIERFRKQVRKLAGRDK